MTRLEKLISSVVGGIIVVSIAIVLTVAIALCSKFNESIFADMADTGVNVFRNDLNVLLEELGNITEEFTLNENMRDYINNNDTEAISSFFNRSNPSENEFCLITDTAGRRIWASNNFPIVDYDVSDALSGNIVSGFYSDASVPVCCLSKVPLFDQYSQLIGVCVAGYDLSSTDYIDSVKQQVQCDVTLFVGDTRYNTTIINSDGSRATGTTMSDNVKAKVIDGGEIYRGKANILNQRYFVTYEPLLDINGNIIGALFSGQSTAESDKAFRSVTIIGIVIALAIMIVSFFGIAYFTKHIVATPIVILEELANRMSAGELNVPDFEYKFYKNEIGQFATKLQNTKHSLSYMVQDITEVLRKMAEGDFTAHPMIEYYGDFSSIEESFKKIHEGMGDIIQNINLSSEQLLVGTKQMAEGTQVLADGATTQATAVAELNEKISDISKKISGNAENAMNARSLSVQVENDAISQSADMNALVTSMQEIEAKSNDVIDIIRTIDDIAFQTNILALNAAVEAAKAGAAGRGFAVVADEVRMLASESANAAENTTDLITAMVSAIKDGSTKVIAVSSSMEKITNHAKESSDLIDQISAASEQQAESVREINEGISQISDVVQQNSATAQQTAASCEELSGQSTMLKEQINKLQA